MFVNRLKNELDLKVMIKPLTVTKDGSDWLSIDPIDNPSEWFESYTSLLKLYSTIDGIDCIAIGT